MKRAATVINVMTACLWLAGNLTVVLATIAIFKVADHDMQLAGDLAGLILKWWFWIGAGFAILMTAASLYLAVKAWRNQFTAKALLMAALSFLLFTGHAGVLALRAVVEERREVRNGFRHERRPSSEAREADDRFQTAHDMNIDLFMGQTVLLLIVVISGGVILYRRMDPDA